MARTERNHRPSKNHAPLPVHLFSSKTTLKRRGNIRGYFNRAVRPVASLLNGPGAPRKIRPVISRVHNGENLEGLEGGRRATRKRVIRFRR